MSIPKHGDVAKGKCIARYFLGRPRAVMRFDWEDETGQLSTSSDSDWAGCKATRKSTSGGVVMAGGHLIKTCSRQQRRVALRSAEAELYAILAASAETLGIAAYARDLGMQLKGTIFTDASAALGIAQRRGLGKVGHIDTQALWVQQAHHDKLLGYHTVHGEKNPSDICTKHVPAEVLNTHMEFMNVQIEGAVPREHQISALCEAPMKNVHVSTS